MLGWMNKLPESTFNNKHGELMKIQTEKEWEIVVDLGGRWISCVDKITDLKMAEMCIELAQECYPGTGYVLREKEETL